jgi:hypothetical protein
MTDDQINDGLLQSLANGKGLSYIAAQRVVLLGNPLPQPNTNRDAALAAHPGTRYRFDDRAYTGIVVKDVGKRTLFILPDQTQNSGRSEFEDCLGRYGYPMGGKKGWSYQWP